MSAFFADVLVVFHLLFVVFVISGGFLLPRWPKLIWLHLPAAFWGVWIEFSGGICPLTPLENQLRTRAGEPGYSGSFVDHYLLPILYPENLTQEIQWLLGSLVIIVNLIAYARAYKAWRKKLHIQRDHEM
jgi:hypothetical protein